MPYEGEIKLGREIGKENSDPSHRFIWVKCPGCKQERWVELWNYKRARTKGYCPKCCVLGKRHPNWKGGKNLNKEGYITIRLYPDDFFYSMADKLHHRVLEHRLVVAKALGRCLHTWEIVHHKGAKYPKGSKEDKADNRYPENLQLVTDDRHKQLTLLEAKINRLEKRIEELVAK